MKKETEIHFKRGDRIYYSRKLKVYYPEIEPTPGHIEINLNNTIQPQFWDGYIKNFFRVGDNNTFVIFEYKAGRKAKNPTTE